MELTAVIEALKVLPRRSLVYVVSDSLYVRSCFRRLRKLKRVKINRDLCELLREAIAGKCVRYRWVRGHDTNAGNVIVDDMAENARKRVGTGSSPYATLCSGTVPTTSKAKLSRGQKYEQYLL